MRILLGGGGLRFGLIKHGPALRDAWEGKDGNLPSHGRGRKSQYKFSGFHDSRMIVSSGFRCEEDCRVRISG